MNPTTVGQAATLHVSIYALLDPFTDEIRYIGQAINVNERLAEHLNLDRPDTNSAKRKWVRGLMREGRRPHVRVLWTGPAAEADAKEAEFIEGYRASGADLLNLAPGGRSNRSVSKLGNASQDRLYHLARWRRQLRRDLAEFLDEVRQSIGGNLTTPFGDLPYKLDRLGDRIADRVESGRPDFPADLFRQDEEHWPDDADPGGPVS